MTDLLAESLPCPFCGCKENLGRVYSGTHDEYYVQCFDCDAHGPVHADDNDACVAWNTRHQSAEIAQAVRDAERYRWLLTATNRDWVVGKNSSTGGCYQYYGDEISQAINDAMRGG